MLQQIENRLGAHYMRSTIDQRLVGIHWYALAYKQAQKFADEFELPMEKVIGVMAALSPNNKWERNVKDTELFLRTPSLETKVCTFLGQRRKALMILQARDRIEIPKILNGRKTISFYSNILNHASNMVVTVDLWMFRAAELPQTAKNYELISQAVTAQCAKHGLMPHQYQAIIWSVVRPNKGA